MQLGVFDDLKIIKGEDSLIKYEGSSGVFRNSCSNCGSFCYKVLSNGAMVAPLGALEGDTVVQPTCHIFVKDRGDQAIMFPELPQHDEFP
jgi:hypothetical protein